MKKLIWITLAPVVLQAAGMKAGLARIDITPEKPIYMSGYASRTKPSEGVLNRLWAKALAVDDGKGGRVVVVTTDLIGLPRSVSDFVAARVQKEYRLGRGQLLLNSSHTHTGPVIRDNLMTMFDLKEDEVQVIREYTRSLADKLVAVTGAALADLQPAVLSYGAGSAPFAINRRQPTEKGIRLGVNPSGPTDREVPVIRVMSADGKKLLGVLFAYACHNTTLTGEFFQISGDYAGFAQEEFEKAHPGAAALFVILCAGDQNPEPRSKLELARQHGKTLADEVGRVIEGPMQKLEGPVRTAFHVTELTFKSRGRAEFEEELKDSNKFKVKRAQGVLAAMDRQLVVMKTPYPAQAVRFGKGLTLFALGGEVVIDYQLRIKKEFPGEPVVVAGYSNDVMCYIPSARVLREGGYEAVDSMIYYGMPGPFDETVEDKVMGAVYNVAKKVGRAPKAARP